MDASKSFQGLSCVPILPYLPGVVLLIYPRLQNLLPCLSTIARDMEGTVKLWDYETRRVFTFMAPVIFLTCRDNRLKSHLLRLSASGQHTMAHLF
jgi:hypothetical protein